MGRGMFGGKAPMTIDLASVTETGVTKQGNVSVEFAGAYGEYGWWKLLFSDARISDHWMQLVHAASSHSAVRLGAAPRPLRGRNAELVYNRSLRLWLHWPSQI